ncbi:MAG: hypothetical protein A3F67_04475 [Verrucomicrobia bacterium RIFCSPHIGHO2_12_FULL_41_10]|nr:MAG: hypothetical protein A3F67_04475 [Verrucomicrobia bacterium RIFCSPHIGHO2_12_FULL_41_10]
MDDLDTHSLMRLKRYEKPSDNNVEQFIAEFQRRQRAELLSPSLLQTLRQRLAHFIATFQVPTMAYVTATALAVFLSILILHNDTFGHKFDYRTALQHSELYAPSTPINQIPSAMDRVEPVSLSVHGDDTINDSSVHSPSYFLQKRFDQRASLLSL